MAPPRRAWERLPYRTAQRGQALLVAVLVLFAVATLAALFAAILGSQLAQAARAGDVVQLRNIAEAGLRFANDQLTYGTEGADWRPSQRVYRTGGGEFSIAVSYGPDPKRPDSLFLRIVASAVFADNPFLRHTILALKPVLLTDYVRFITDRFETGQPASLGVAGVELGGDTRGYGFQLWGPIRSNTDLTWHGPAEVRLYNKLDQTWNRSNVLGDGRSLMRDDRIEVAGQFRPPAGDTTALPLGVLSLWVNDVHRTADFFHPTAASPDYEWGYPDAWRSEDIPAPNTWRVLANLPEYPVAGVGTEPEWRSAQWLAPPRIRPPLMDALHPDLLTNRYLAITRDSGKWQQVGTTFRNTGQYGWGWTNFGGIYVDNTEDIQYNHDLERLRLNWVGSVGVHQNLPEAPGDLRKPTTTSPPAGPADWWDRTGRYYAPPGVEIVLHGEAPCPYIEIARDYKNDEETYWRDADGTAVSHMRYTGGPTLCQPADTSVSFGVSLAKATFPFPPNGVIYAEGNVRIRGIMPPVRGEPVTYWDGPGVRGYDLQVVSGGTIYIEGDLLTPGPEGAALSHQYAQGVAPLNSLERDLQWGSRLALLARDYVCVNTTALNPRPRDLYAAMGDDRDQYYNDAQPVYPEDEHPNYMFFQGPRDASINSDAYAAGGGWDGTTPFPTEPPGLDLVYNNVRLLDAREGGMRDDLAALDLRLLIGHSGWYSLTDADGEPVDEPIAPPPDPDPGSSDVARVDVAIAIGTPSDLVEDAALFLWGYGTSPYTFLRDAAHATKDESGHWYTTTDPLERLPDEYQSMGVLADLLTGNDVLFLRSWVSPIRHYTDDEVDGWQVRPRELGYVLGPVAIAPGRYLSDAETEAPPLPVQIQALIYAQNGSWFIIPGPWFNEDASNNTYDTEWPGYHEPLNIAINFYGAISENMPAPPGDVADWTSKWSGPNLSSFDSLTYRYDPLLRWPRLRRDPTDVSRLVPTPRFPRLPLTSDLLVWGERISGTAGG